MFTQHIQKMTKFLFFFGALLFLSGLALTLSNIGMRAMDSSLRGAVELSGFLGAAALGLCLPHIQLQKAHANAGIFHKHLPPLIQKLLHVLVTLCCFGITLACTRELMDLTLFTYEGMEVIDGLSIPSAYFVAALSLGCAGQCLVLGLEVTGFIQKTLQKLRTFAVKSPALAYRGK